MSQPLRLEGASDHLFTHAVEQGKGRGLAIGAQHFAESGFQAASAMISGSIPADNPSAQASLWLSTAVRRFSSLTNASMSLTACSIAMSTLFKRRSVGADQAWAVPFMRRSQ
ncbi:hypothetical protein AJ88_29275 [Mesorhizobium amorphae CCBAU 01583]|nr:hypothetical protein AJ88_29275 [Mesorhizobium amorphae CCBAU 01583]